VPATEGFDPHEIVISFSDVSRTMALQFLKTGVAESVCDGPCDPS
jgi:hypothetical protein